MSNPYIGQRVTIRGGFDDGIAGVITATRKHCTADYPVYTVTVDDGTTTAELGGIAAVSLEPDATFVEGRTYTARSIGDHECVFRFIVWRRSAKFLTLGDINNKPHRVGIVVRDGIETALPLGRYSMAPVIRADRWEK